LFDGILVWAAAMLRSQGLDSSEDFVTRPAARNNDEGLSLAKILSGD
jgi:hypothetical protein